METKPTTYEERIAAIRAIGESCRRSGEEAAVKIARFIAAWNESAARDRR